MQRILPAALGLVLVLGAGITEGVWNDRWGQSNEPAASAAKLDNVAMVVGDWKGEDGERLSPAALAIGEIAHYLSRAYANQATGTKLSVLIVCGRAGPIGVHTPDVCFVGGGMDMVSKTRRVIPQSPPDLPIECFVGQFRRVEAEQRIDSRAFWSWSSNGTWQAPDSPRLKFAGARALFKLYVTRNIARDDEPIETDPSLDFLKAFIPELNKTLFDKPSSESLSSSP